MLLRAAIVMLVMLNLGAATWWLLRARLQAMPQPRHHAVEVGAPGLRLLDEPAARPTPPGAADPVVAANPASEPPSQSAPAERVQVEQVCLRFGPFADAEARAVARAALASAGVSASPRETAARSARGWKVWLPPLASREDAVAMAERIKAAGVTDLYVMSQGEDANSVALGRFGGEEAARRREAELRGKGFAAQAVPLGDTPAQVWLDARLPAGVDRVALVRIAPARPLDCASPCASNTSSAGNRRDSSAAATALRDGGCGSSVARSVHGCPMPAIDTAGMRTFSPIPITARAEPASSPPPSTNRPPSFCSPCSVSTTRSFGHFRRTRAKPMACSASQATSPATRLNPLNLARPPSKRRASDRYRFEASGDAQSRPRRPRPPVWRSASSTAQPAAGVSRRNISLLVESSDHAISSAAGCASPGNDRWIASASSKSNGCSST